MIKLESKFSRKSNYINPKCVSIQHESNYFLLKLVLPELTHQSFKSSVSNKPELHLEVLNSYKYTTELQLEYQFNHSKSESIVIRIYEDAKVAEIAYCTDFQEFVRKMGVKISPQVHFKTRVSLNSFLHKWLKYLLQNKYRSYHWQAIK